MDTKKLKLLAEFLQEATKFKNGQHVVYTGPDLPDLKKGEEAAVKDNRPKNGKIWIANMNMPFLGGFTGFVDPKYLKVK